MSTFDWREQGSDGKLKKIADFFTSTGTLIAKVIGSIIAISIFALIFMNGMEAIRNNLAVSALILVGGISLGFIFIIITCIKYRYDRFIYAVELAIACMAKYSNINQIKKDNDDYY